MKGTLNKFCKRLLRLVSILLMIGIFLPVRSQDPQFSQFYSAPLYLSPSLTGSGNGTRMILNFRDQWPKLPGAFITYAFSIDHYFDQYKSGLGLLILRDDAGGGLYTTTDLGILYSYTITINKNFSLRPGLRFLSYHRKISDNTLYFTDQIYRDATTTIENSHAENIQHYDFSGSLLAYYNQFWLGASMDHMLSISNVLAETGDYLPLKISVYGGGKFPLPTRKLTVPEQSISAAFFYKMQDRYQQVDLGMYYNYADFMVGIWFRGMPILKDRPGLDAVTVSAGYNFNDFTISYSYDMAVSQLIASIGGAHEIALKYTFKQSAQSRKKKKMASIPCPVF